MSEYLIGAFLLLIIAAAIIVAFSWFKRLD